ncbi:MAG TPA: CHAT domain-containing protein [Gemmatimonadaceae bacterium]|nr:CHAT domain-containing protein [Gemmatimonadaceae bacterium]
MSGPTPRGVIVVTPQEYRGTRYHNFDVDEAFGGVVSRGGVELTCKSTDSEFTTLSASAAQDAVRKAGEKLFATLSTSKGVQELFTAMSGGLSPVLQPGALKSYPLFVKIEGDSPEPDGIPWEIIWEQRRQFLCLDPRGRWPVARLVSASTRLQPIVRSIEPVLKVALVLAAVGESGAEEWKSFEQAVAALSVAVHVLVLVSEDAALDAARKDLAGWSATRGTGEVRFVGDQASLVEQILAFSPNILHFFCHGTADTAPELEVETRVDRRSDPPKSRGSIRLTETQLAGVAIMRSLWLVVLNCCRGARPTPNLHSLARSLVTSGVPAVVAMRESIDVADGNLFTQSFYRSLLKQLSDEVFALYPAPASATDPLCVPELLWMKATDEARRGLSQVPGRDPATHSQWTYPVLYIYRDELRLERRDRAQVEATLEQKVEKAVPLALLNQLFESMRPGADPASDRKRREVATILGLEKSLEDAPSP